MSGLPRIDQLLIDATDRLSGVAEGEDTWRALQEVAAMLGANAMNAAGLQIGTRAPLWMRLGMGPKWLELYEQAEFHRVDPLVDGMMNDRLKPVYDFAGDEFGARSDDLSAMMNSELAAQGYRFFWARTWVEADQEKFIVLSTEEDIRDVLGPQGESALHVISALMSARCNAPEQMNGLLGIHYQALSGRERDVLCLLAAGYDNMQIAERLGIAEVTVRLHMKKAREKMGAKTREQALVLAMARGQLSL